jgi:thiosulfate reductase cytochrome b subunit
MNTPMQDDRASAKGGDLVSRHRLSTRMWHWLNFVTVTVMLMSGLMIFNAHPRLYWGRAGANFDHAWLEIHATATGKGLLRIGGLVIDTTGVLGSTVDYAGVARHRAFPWWATIPSDYNLADARLWSLVNGHLRRDIHITRREWRPAHIWQDIRDHARLRFPTGIAALRYNVLQKLAYAGVLFVLLPGAILTGLAMSPGVDAAVPFLADLFGGRQSARSIHFLCAFGLVGFFVVHIVMVMLAGPFNEVRSMITGRYRLPADKEPTP